MPADFIAPIIKGDDKLDLSGEVAYLSVGVCTAKQRVGGATPWYVQEWSQPL